MVLFSVKQTSPFCMPFEMNFISEMRIIPRRCDLHLYGHLWLVMYLKKYRVKEYCNEVHVKCSSNSCHIWYFPYSHIIYTLELESIERRRKKNC